MQDIIKILEETGVLMQGHFLLSSGRHSNRYLQCARVFQHPRYAGEICRRLAEKFTDTKPDICIGPALGGVIIAYERPGTGAQALFVERIKTVETLRRGFSITPGEKVLILEDVVTTGGSVREVMEVVRSHKGEICGIGCLVDRSGGKADFGVPFRALLQLDIASYDPADCPLCKKGVPAVKPGSRK